jgi:5-bromo-4-chloroindolyl phosphate hydrolysis protein
MTKATRYKPATEVLDTVKTGIKGTLLFLMPLPVLITAIIHLLKGHLIGSITAGALFVGFMVAAIVARHGFKLESRFKKKKLARAPGTPFKSVAAILLASVTGLTAFLLSNYGLFSSILIGFVTMIGFYLAYGIDPRRDKTGNISLGVSADEVFEALEEAEIKIAVIEQARENINNLDFDQHLKRIIKKARGILSLIEEDPRDLTRARKFLKVYLEGTARVTESYAKTYGRDATTKVLDTNFQEVLDSIESTFDEQHQKLLRNDQLDLDVKIEVLKTQLKGL